MGWAANQIFNYIQMEIKKIKLTKADRLEITTKRDNGDGDVVESNEKHSGKAHPDFTNALKKMQVHLGMLTGYIRPSDVKDPSSYMHDVDNFIVSGYSIGGEDEDQGVVITGHMIVPHSKKAVILNCPFTRFNEDETTRYKHMDHLISIIEEVKEETKKYMGGKFATEIQPSLQFDKDEAAQ